MLLENHKYDAENDVLVTIQNSVITTETKPASNEEVLDDIDENYLRRVDFNQLHSINHDVKCWLYIPNSYVDYPIMQESSIGTYQYLYADIYKHENSMGSLFTPAEPNNAKDAHFLIFGHQMVNCSLMFGGLFDMYAGYDNGMSNQYIYLYYPDRIERWTLSMCTKVQSDDAIYKIPYTTGSSAYIEAVNNIWSDKYYDTGNKITGYENMVVLSTCSANDGEDVRFIVCFTLDDTYKL